MPPAPPRLGRIAAAVRVLREERANLEADIQTVPADIAAGAGVGEAMRQVRAARAEIVQIDRALRRLGVAS